MTDEPSRNLDMGILSVLRTERVRKLADAGPEGPAYDLGGLRLARVLDRSRHLLDTSREDRFVRGAADGTRPDLHHQWIAPVVNDEAQIDPARRALGGKQTVRRHDAE